MKKKPVYIRLSADVSLHDIGESIFGTGNYQATGISDKQLIDFIANLDDSVCRLEFSEKLVRRLIKPIRESMEPDEFKKFIASLGRTA